MTSVEANTLVPASTLRDLSAEQLDVELDTLLAKYLHLLDQYTEARKDLSRKLSEGFLSLASANFSAPRGVRYGQDYYDDRMQARRTVTINEIDERVVTSIIDSRVEARRENESPKAAEDDENTDEDKENRAPDVSKLSDENENAGDATSRDIKESSEVMQSSNKDPLRWFGAFVSPKLRATQSQFESVIDTDIITIDNLKRTMKSTEIEIRRCRKRLAKGRP